MDALVKHMGSSATLEKILRFFRKYIIPRAVFNFFQPAYHWTLALLGAILYRFPSRKIDIVAITGTKGKTTSVELVNAILEEAGYKTALVSTLRAKVGADSRPNLFKMSTPGRFFLQRFLREAVDAGCDWMVMELTSEAAKLYRHKFIALNALIFTNIAPEHIESHGSFEKYLDAKLSLARALASSPKRPRIMIANLDNEHGQKFLDCETDARIGFHITDAAPFTSTSEGSTFQFLGTQMASKLPGRFNLENILGALHFAHAIGIETEVARRGIMRIEQVPGRAEIIHAPQGFDVVVDYAHTPDSLRAIYETFGTRRKIAVLGSCGGGRDTWKRPLMGKVAGAHCEYVIVTNEDPYDEDPRAIAETVAQGIPDTEKMEIIMDRREAIRKAISLANKGDVVLITGKGTDPYIMEADGKKLPWSDRRVVEEELAITSS